MAKVNRKYILDIGGTCWRVKIRVDLDKQVNASFNYANQSRETLLKRAVEWRDLTLKKHGLLDRLNYEHSPHTRKRKKRGEYVGVCQSKRSWIARYTENGKEKKRCFSKTLYGERAAYQKACDIRAQYTKLIRM